MKNLHIKRKTKEEKEEEVRQKALKAAKVIKPRKAAARQRRSTLRDKTKESLSSILPIAALVLILCFLVVPVPASSFAGFILASALLVLGMGLFNQGTELAMTPIGQAIGHSLTKSKNLWVLLVAGFIVGAAVTISEPDLTVLAGQVNGVPDLVLILTVALGVGMFLTLALFRTVRRIKLSYVLFVCYAVVFILSLFIDKNFLAVAFDSGGVTTGPMTVPFILGLGVGVSSIRNDEGAESDSFGLVALGSIGPILAVMILSLIYKTDESAVSQIVLTDAGDSTALFRTFLTALPSYLKEVGIALAPIIIIFVIFQLTSLHLHAVQLRRIILGLIYTYAGLTIFLLGVNVGFMPVGNYIGQAFGASHYKWLLVPVGMLIGWFIVSAEPAVQVLNQQVYEITAGAIPKKAMNFCLSLGVSVSVGLSMIRALTGISIMWFIVPGYLLAGILMFFCPPVFTGIAFDSGGVASGPMTATFLLPLAIGVVQATGGNVATDAFGVVAMVAMTPLIAIQVMGVIYKIRQKRSKPTLLKEIRDEIIDL